MRFVNVDAVIDNLEGMKEMGIKDLSIDAVIEIIDRYPKLEFDPADRKDKKNE